MGAFPHVRCSFRVVMLAVDLDYLEGVCRLCRVAGVDHFSLVSSQGASPSSPLLYPKVKGQCEKVNIDSCSFLQARDFEFLRRIFVRAASTL